MIHYGTILLILPIFLGNKIINGQHLPMRGIQQFLNNYCDNEYPDKGCKPIGIADPNDAVATVRPTTIIAPVSPTPASPECGANEKLCPQLQTKCVPNEIDCNVINAGITCRIPDDYGVVTLILECGDETPVGVRCGSDGLVPVLTKLLVKCQSSNAVDLKPESSSDVLAGPGNDGGAGVYRCSPQGTWEPQSQSPFLRQLTVSCKNADCGRILQPSENMPIHRKLAWVRAIYKRGLLHCTATLVSPTAVVTAAHCLTWSNVSNRIDPDLHNYELELPGPNRKNPRIKIQPESMYIHPRYDYRNQQHDLAIIFFKMDANYNLPTVCITDQAYNPTRGKKQVVASLQQAGINGSPLWKFSKAGWNHSCITHTSPVKSGCADLLEVEQSQFCATHEGMSMNPGSSGGPYLAEVGNEEEEVWALMGVLSKFSNASSCSRYNSIYGQVADDSRWIKDCVFDKKCTF